MIAGIEAGVMLLTRPLSTTHGCNASIRSTFGPEQDYFSRFYQGGGAGGIKSARQQPHGFAGRGAGGIKSARQQPRGFAGCIGMRLTDRIGMRLTQKPRGRSPLPPPPPPEPLLLPPLPPKLQPLLLSLQPPPLPLPLPLPPPLPPPCSRCGHRRRVCHCCRTTQKPRRSFITKRLLTLSTCLGLLA